MDEAGVKEWIRQCLPRTPCNEQSLLVWDSFRAHLTDEVKADLNWQKIDVAVIPGGLTRFAAIRQVLEQAVQR